MPKQSNKKNVNKIDKTITKIEKFIDILEKNKNNFKNQFEINFYKDCLKFFNKLKKITETNLIIKRLDSKIDNFKKFIKNNKSIFNKIEKIENKTDMFDEDLDTLILNINNKFTTFQYEENLKDSFIINRNIEYNIKFDILRSEIEKTKNKKINWNIDDDWEGDIETNLSDELTPLDSKTKVLFWYRYLKWILYNNDDEWSRAKKLEEEYKIPIEIEHFNNFILLIKYISNNKIKYEDLINSDLENGNFDNLKKGEDNKKKINQYKYFINQLIESKYTRFSLYHRDNLKYYGLALKQLEKKFKKLSIKNKDENIILEFYNKLISLIEISMHEKTVYQFFTNDVSGRTLPTKKSNLTPISQKFANIWLFDRDLIWGAKKGKNWLNPNKPGTPGYSSLKGFLMGFSRPIIIFKQKFNKDLDWDSMNIYEFIRKYEIAYKSKNLYTKSLIPNLYDYNYFFSKSQNKLINPMNATYMDNFNKDIKDKSPSNDIYNDSPLSSLKDVSSGFFTK